MGELEAAMLKPGPLNERLLAEKAYYQAFATDLLCRRAKDTPLVYHGRSGHMILPEVQHVLRLRVAQTLEERVGAVLERLSLSWKQAREYIEAVDEDRKRWTRTLYEREWDVSHEYDLVLNMDHPEISGYRMTSGPR